MAQNNFIFNGPNLRGQRGPSCPIVAGDTGCGKRRIGTNTGTKVLKHGPLCQRFLWCLAPDNIIATTFSNQHLLKPLVELLVFAGDTGCGKRTIDANTGTKVM